VSLLRFVALIIAFVSAAFAFAPQQPPSAEPNYEFVSGTIADLPPGKLVVNRAVPGKPPEMRTFLLTAETKIEGRLRVRARVTVGFRPSAEGDVAMRIIVRAQTSDPKK
jgi:hypothetical protein